MNKTKILLALIIIPVLTLFSYKATFSFFSNQATSTSNTFAAASTFPTPAPSPCPSPSVSHMIVNEVSPLGDSNAEWVELFNPTCDAIDVSGWKISDKNAFDNGEDDTFPSSSPTPAKGFVVVITNNSIVAGIPSSAITITLGNASIGSGLNNTGGDEVILKNSSNTIIDAMSYGNVTDVFASPPPIPTSGKTLSRNPNGVDTDSASDWTNISSPSLGVSN